MSGETQPRRRKDKRKKKGRAEVQDTEQWQDDQLEAHDDNQFYVEPDSVSDDGTGDEEMKGHSTESGGSSCVTVLVFMVLLAAVGVLLGLIYVQSQGIAHVETPAQPVAQPRVETIVETITEGGEVPPPADDQGEGAPADQQEGGQQAQVVEQVIEEHIVYVDAPPDQQQSGQGEQVVYVESPPVADGIQLEGSEPQLEEQYGAQPPAPPPVPMQMAGGQEMVQEERLVRMRQVVRQVTDADGNVQEEVISEEEVPEDYVEPGESATVEEPAADQAAETTPEPEQQQQQEEEAPAADEGVDVTEPAEDSPAPPAGEEEAAVEVEKVAETEEAAPAEEKQEEEVEAASEVPAEAEDAPPQEEVSEAVVEEEVEDATPQVEEVEEVLTESEVEDEPQSEEQPQEEVASPAEPPAPASVPSSHSVPVDTNKQERPAAQQKPSQANKVEESKQPVREDKPKEPVKEEKVKEPVKEEKVKEPVKEEKAKEPVKEEKAKESVKEEKAREPVKEETAKEPVKEEKAKEPVKEEKAKEPVKEEKAKEPVKEEKAKEPVKEEKAEEPVKEEKPNEPVKEEKAKEPVKDEKVKASVKEEVEEPVKEEKAKEPVKEEKAKETVEAKKTKEPVKEEKPTQKPTVKSEAKPTEAPVKKEAPTEKPKVAAPTEKPAAEEAPTEKPAPKTPSKEAEEIERVRSGSRVQQQRPGPASKPADKPQEPPARARSQPPVESATDKHAKQTGKQAVAEDEGIVADVDEQRDEPADAGAEYGKADVTGPEDWDIREELDAADGVVDTDPLAALNAFGAILSRRPRSPRALWGRARALNAQATQERSNNALDKAIKAFRVVLDLEPETPVPLELYRQAAETCVQQMRFRGQLDQAARIQQRLIQKFPDNHQLRNHLATVFMTYGQNSAAEEVLQEVLRLWPDNGYAKVHLGFIRRQEGKHQVATELMQAGLASDEPGVHDKRFYYALGDSYDRIGRRDRALEIYQEAVSRGLMLSVLQRSLINVDRLTARPYWTAEQSGSEPLVRELEANFQTIRGEMLTLLDSERPEDGFQPEQEDLSKSGDWRQYTMYRRGRKNQYACVKTPHTCDLIAKFPEAAGCRRGQIKFSMLGPGTTVWPHTGPTNCRLRLHLGLKVPNGTGIRVAGEKRTWEEGKVLIIDDSFEHDVWNESDATRYVLIVDIWHPELTEEERRTLPSV